MPQGNLVSRAVRSWLCHKISQPKHCISPKHISEFSFLEEGWVGVELKPFSNWQWRPTATIAKLLHIELRCCQQRGKRRNRYIFWRKALKTFYQRKNNEPTYHTLSYQNRRWQQRLYRREMICDEIPRDSVGWICVAQYRYPKEHLESQRMCGYKRLLWRWALGYTSIPSPKRARVYDDPVYLLRPSSPDGYGRRSHLRGWIGKRRI